MNDNPTHGDIMAAIRDQREDSAVFRQMVTDRFRDLFQISENLEVSIDRIDGRVERVEAKVLRYDMMGARVAGAVGAIAVLIGVVWWLVKDKLAALFGVTGS